MLLNLQMADLSITVESKKTDKEIIIKVLGTGCELIIK